jgi:hypothetical protein
VLLGITREDFFGKAEAVQLQLIIDYNSFKEVCSSETKTVLCNFCLLKLSVAIGFLALYEFAYNSFKEVCSSETKTVLCNCCLLKPSVATGFLALYELRTKAKQDHV